MGSDKYTHASADISVCKKYRYSLYRAWNHDLPGALFIMLTPSTADGDADDPTIRKCVGYARQWNCGSVMVVNLFAFRATKPSDLIAHVKAGDAIGINNDFAIQEAINRHSHHGDYIVAAWGVWGSNRHVWQRRNNVLAKLPLFELSCLGMTKGGDPQHPLYLRGDLCPMPYARERLALEGI